MNIYVFLSGDGANDFALKQGIKLEPDEFFFSQFRYDQWKKMRDSDNYSLDHSNDQVEKLMRDKKFGTVGAVACDAEGNIAAATSTGGMTNKKYGRVGDCPIIGAGTYANNATCAVSATGHGEYFIRSVVAHDIAAMMEYKGASVQEAAEAVVMKKLVERGGAGGVIALDAKGTIAMPFNTSGMYRASIAVDGTVTIEIFAVAK